VALREKEPCFSQYLKNPDSTTVASKTALTEAQPRRREHHHRGLENNSTDNMTANDTNTSANGDVPFHYARSTVTPSITFSHLAVAPRPPTTRPQSDTTPLSPPSPTVSCDIINPATTELIIAIPGGARDPAH